MKSLLLRQARLINFKNYAEAVFRFGEKFTLVIGRNGVGKTNLLDAIYYLCVGKSYFTSLDHRIVRQGEDFLRLEGDVLHDREEVRIVVKVKPGSVKEISRNGNPYARIGEHLGFMPVVFSAPRDMDIVTGTGEVRRRYVDHLLCQVDPSYLASLQAYNHLLALRNAALKQALSGLHSLLETYDEQMTPHATLIYQRRAALMEDLSTTLKATYAFISEEAESVSIAYSSPLHEYPYHILADRARELDRLTQRSSTGIHKDDYLLTIRDLPAREFGSQGQIKSLIFALHLSKYRLLRDRSEYLPLLILDDIFDKLDEHRLRRLMETLTAEEFGQVFISDTSSDRVAGMLADFPVHQVPVGSG